MALSKPTTSLLLAKTAVGSTSATTSDGIDSTASGFSWNDISGAGSTGNPGDGYTGGAISIYDPVSGRSITFTSLDEFYASAYSFQRFLASRSHRYTVKWEPPNRPILRRARLATYTQAKSAKHTDTSVIALQPRNTHLPRPPRTPNLPISIKTPSDLTWRRNRHRRRRSARYNL